MKRMLKNKFILCLYLGMLAGNVDATSRNIGELIKQLDIDKNTQSESDEIDDIKNSINELNETIQSLNNDINNSKPNETKIDECNNKIERNESKLKDLKRLMNNVINDEERQKLNSEIEKTENIITEAKKTLEDYLEDYRENLAKYNKFITSRKEKQKEVSELTDQQKIIKAMPKIRTLICDLLLNKQESIYDEKFMKYIEHRGYLGQKDLQPIHDGKKYYIGRCCTNIPRPIFSKVKEGVYEFRKWSELNGRAIEAPKDENTLAVIKDQIKEFLRGGINNIQYKETVTPKNSDYSFHSFTCQIDAVKTTFIIVSKQQDVSKLKKENIEKILVDFEGGE